MPTSVKPPSSRFDTIGVNAQTGQGIANLYLAFLVGLSKFFHLPRSGVV